VGKPLGERTCSLGRQGRGNCWFWFPGARRKRAQKVVPTHPSGPGVLGACLAGARRVWGDGALEALTTRTDGPLCRSLPPLSVSGTSRGDCGLRAQATVWQQQILTRTKKLLCARCDRRAAWFWQPALSWKRHHLPVTVLKKYVFLWTPLKGTLSKQP